MAEGGGSIYHGSDADFEYTCSPCREDDIRVEAVKYCPVCQEYLCTTCTRYHGKLRRSHALLDCDASMKVPEVTMVTKCRYHPERDIEMFCGEHDMVYCTKCIATEHRSCRDVSSLEDVKISRKRQKEIERLKTVATYTQKRLADTERRMQANIESVEEQKSDAMSKIKEAERDLIKHIRKLKQEAMEILEAKYTVVMENLETDISQIKKVKVENERQSYQLQAVDKLEMRQQFIQTKIIEHTLNNAMKIMEENEAKGCQNLRFKENNVLKSSIITSTSLGSVQNVSGIYSQLSSKVYKVSSKNEINVNISNDNVVCYISDKHICQLPDGTIMLADFCNKRIKRLDVNYNIKDYFDVGDRPTGICCTGNTEVAVKLMCNKVQFISVGRSLSKLRDITITSGGYWGLAYCAGELWVSTGRGVDVYSMSGSLLKTISKNGNGQNIFKSTTYHMAVSGDTVIVTDNSDGAVCLRRDGSVIKELRDGRLMDTQSVCVVNDEIVLIGGYRSHNIVAFDRDGKCLGELLDKEGGLKNPVSMCCDKKRNCVLVSNASANTIVVFNMSN